MIPGKIRNRKTDRDVTFAFYEEDENVLVCSECYEPLMVVGGGTKLICPECEV